MEQGSEKYKKILNLLRRSKPELPGIEILEEKVIDRIRTRESMDRSFSDLFENLFAWLYVSWVRRSLIAAALLLILFFTYQQTMILKGVKNIAGRTVVTGNGEFSLSEDEIGKRLMIMRLSGRGITTHKLHIPEKQIEQLLESYYELQDKYSGLLKIIEEDPALKKYIENELNESGSKKVNL